MKTLFSTDHVHAHDRFDYWRAVVCENLVVHDSRPESMQTFHAKMQSADLADVGILLSEHAPVYFWHRTHHTERMNADEFFICRLVAGTVTVDQGNREVVLAAGDMALFDPRLSWFGGFASDAKLQVFKVGRRDLTARIGDPRDITCRAMRQAQPEHGLLSAVLAMLPVHAGNMGVAAAEIAKDRTLDLFAVSCAQLMGGHKPRLSSARSLALLTVHGAIDARLADPALDAVAVAAAAGVSVRYANTVLAERDTSIMRLIQEKRLARCRKALADPLQAHRTISEIAYGWGFSDMTHFGRRFKAAFGLLPSDCREGLRRFPPSSRQAADALDNRVGK